MAQRVIAIGDIHGCIQALTAILEAIRPSAEDVIVPLGDYVDRGTDSRAVLDHLISLREQCKLHPVLGNHDEMMLNVIRGELQPELWVACGGVSTLESYGFVGDLDVIPAEHIEFLEQCIEYYETDTHFFVHANYDAGVPLNEQNEYALRWRKLDEEMPIPHVSDRVAVVGHTPTRDREILDRGYLQCIDTCCYGDGWLTALDVTTGDVWQATKDGKLRAD
jgi:serine/threonine protein phosphatase 1